MRTLATPVLILLGLFSLGLLSGSALAQNDNTQIDNAQIDNTDNRVDLIRFDAPELAAYGPHDIGVRTLDFVNEDELDIVNAVQGEPIPRYNRPLTVEVWYPADLEGEALGEYAVTTRDGAQVTLSGRAVRDAKPSAADAPYPLIIISHGYPGNRFLLAHLGENLASKGYVTVSIDHTDSTYSDQATFGSTLLNRPLDQGFVLDEMARLSQADSGSFLAGLVDTEETGLLGYSMGAYGAVNFIGGGLTQMSVNSDYAPPNGILSLRQAGNEAYQESLDPRVKAVVAIAPWGMNTGFWDAQGLAGVETPLFFMAGSADDVSGYEEGTKAIFEKTVNAERYLLTFEGANHNAAAPIPAPVETWGGDAFMHYSDAVWNTVRMNNIAQHFTTAFFDLELKGDVQKGEYLDLLRDAEDGVWSVDESGNFTEEHTYWKGFPERTAVGLSLRHREAAE